MMRDRKKHSTALLGIDNYSLEHVMPKNWVKNWKPVSTEADRLNRNKAILTLGNLTIITSSLNSSIRDADWLTKKNGRGKNHGLVHFASGIETFSPYLEKDEWDETIIIDRAEMLCENAKEIWRNPSML